jgi:hypothetical protein
MSTDLFVSLLSLLLAFSTIAFGAGRMYEKLYNELLNKKNKRKK